ncbi:MAG TPA: phosphate ABC transporter ATP-binding protein [Anaerolineaceae bacterium]|jgi:phosphate transport system ATP-binding protein|nr:phosphate ABC transporter ATP-binding protein [Anaerolineaceae bacterium]
MKKFIIENLSVRYSDDNESLRNINLEIEEHAITVLFGPANGGKSTFLRTLNRLNDLADVKEVSGRVSFNGVNILDRSADVIELRRKVGMVFSRPVPLPLSIYENVAYGLIMAGVRDSKKLDAAVEAALRQAVLWDEVYDRLQDSAYAISGGQQQRLCLARVLALEPEVIMLDEPTSALDPVATAKIEELLNHLKEKYTIILAPHNIQQSARMADYAAFFLMGEVIEYLPGKEMFLTPHDKRTQDYITGRFG